MQLKDRKIEDQRQTIEDLKKLFSDVNCRNQTLQLENRQLLDTQNDNDLKKQKLDAKLKDLRQEMKQIKKQVQDLEAQLVDQKKLLQKIKDLEAQLLNKDLEYECVICQEYVPKDQRQLRFQCNHDMLCQQCFDDYIKANQKATCPSCRKP